MVHCLQGFLRLMRVLEHFCWRGGEVILNIRSFGLSPCPRAVRTVACVLGAGVSSCQAPGKPMLPARQLYCMNLRRRLRGSEKREMDEKVQEGKGLQRAMEKEDSRDSESSFPI